MAIIEATQNEYELIPEGAYSAKVESVLEGIKRNTSFGEKDALRIRFETEKLGKDGKKLTAILTVNRTIGKGSSLAKCIKQVTGTDPGRRFDPQSLVGTKVLIVIAHNENNGRTYANVAHISKYGPEQGTNGGVTAAAVDTYDVEFPGDEAAGA